ncbi:SRPBCC family protein [Singulisphaera acidiphila]|uniref:Activator of Hsp90 ATPase homologue 1/2-like C-terminal domain-containing protein n=1 Tax=Singulisphaera acidiphila (strain ATCC BAA-1392 / DSM 18658 / VKM B-2454 / MOB10) TaxID=886293 RepID=L0DEX4_SINAD|nr:SRPBCC domain-containing protein [Singulisphaera acidiphila]AGA27390.1 hypothetical protein Sinac_3110 [Singulisphaera acidiphila DSM 18658]
MSLKKEDSGRRWVQVEVEVPGTPEEVWQAIATGPGVSSWFVPTEVREDGTIVSHFGPGMDAVAAQTAWDPPRRFAAEGELGPNAPKMATEWVIEARSGGTCIVRVVHSLFASTDDWDDQLESIEAGWPDYFHILRLYLTHFRGQPCSAFQLMGMAPEPASAAWDVLARSLGLDEAKPGASRKTPANAPRLAGLVERAGGPGHPSQLLLRLTEPTPGIAHLFALSMGGMVFVSVRLYLYGDQAPTAVARDEPSWRAWMNTHFPMSGDPSKSC